MDGKGNARTYTWFGIRQRPYVGNILKDGFSEVLRRLEKIDQEQMESCAQAEEDFIETEATRPLWARYWEGNFSNEDFLRDDSRKRYDPRFASRFSRLVNLYITRRSRLLRAA